eukprot:TRINITY_DN40142_c0_g1_i1.p1 TRINITY_DN40142_c0_g1~~TRINITY_DN40142_c0_g1_i1.p1  ORF type:complete len:726 (+),score=285.51 TRINITY_DN40142_c0_g1_i1:74-2251(+)
MAVVQPLPALQLDEMQGGWTGDGGSEPPSSQDEEPVFDQDPIQRVLDLSSEDDVTIFGWDIENLLSLRDTWFRVARADSLDVEGVKTVLTCVFPATNTRQLAKVIQQIIAESDVDITPGFSWQELSSTILGVPTDITDEDLVCELLDKQYGPPKSRRELLWAIMEQPASNCYRLEPWWTVRVAWIVAGIGQISIVASTMNMIIESLEDLQTSGGSGNTGTRVVEALCIAVFTIEFLLRCCACPLRKDAVRGPMLTQKEFWLLPWTWIDVMAILPFYVGRISGSASGGSLIVLRIVRLTRLARAFRVLKLGRHSDAIQLMATAVYRARLAMIWMVLFLAIAVVLYASFIWHIEKEEATFDFEQQLWIRDITSDWSDAGKPIFFQSIPKAMWWVLVTITTVGYGDTRPVTVGGKAVAAAAMFSGMLLIAYPVTMLTSVFAEVHEESSRRKVRSRQREMLRGVLKMEEDGFCPASPVTSGLLGSKIAGQEPGTKSPRRPQSGGGLAESDVEELQGLVRLLPEHMARLRSQIDTLSARQQEFSDRVAESLKAAGDERQEMRVELLAHFASAKEELLQTYRDCYQPEEVKQRNEKDALRKRVRELVTEMEPAAAEELTQRLEQLHGRDDELTMLRDFEQHLLKRLRAHQRKAHLMQRRDAEPNYEPPDEDTRSGGDAPVTSTLPLVSSSDALLSGGSDQAPGSPLQQPESPGAQAAGPSVPAANPLLEDD